MVVLPLDVLTDLEVEVEVEFLLDFLSCLVVVLSAYSINSLSGLMMVYVTPSISTDWDVRVLSSANKVIMHADKAAVRIISRFIISYLV